MTESFVTQDGLRLTYRVLGAGPTLVCHPGGPGFSSLYFGDLAGLGDRVTLVLLNPRGTADSDRPSDRRAYAVADYVDDLEQLRRHLGLDQMDLLGHSHGGVVAQAYAARYPGHLRRVILASTLPRFQETQVAAMEAGIEARSGEPWYEDARAALDAEQAGEFSSDEELADLALREFPFYFAHYGDGESAYLDTLRAEIPNADALVLFNREVFGTFDLRPALASIESPTLVITGADDFITGPACTDELSAGIPDAETVVLPECGHFIFVEAPDRFRAEVLRFLGAGR